MVPILPLATPVVSALLGALAIRFVETLYARRQGINAIHDEVIENYWRLEGEISDIEASEWDEQYTRQVRLDRLQATKTVSPGVYADIIKSVDNFPVLLTSLENIQMEQKESRRPGAYVSDSPEDIASRLQEIQAIIVSVETNLQQYRRASLLNRCVLAGTAADFDPQDERAISNTSAENPVL